MAVLEKRMGLRFFENDVYLNVAGGIRLDEPSADLSIAMALISGITDRVISDDLIAFGEIGLAGECRAVSSLETRVKEAERLGFHRVIIPYRNIEKRPIDAKIRLIPIKSVYEMLSLLSGDNGGDK
jgi:DNA repair protein RadA/Sms